MLQPARRSLCENLRVVGVALAAAILVRRYFLQPFIIDGVSMQNTVQNHERLLVAKLPPRYVPLHYGELVVFQPPIPDYQGDYIKRVIATGGQTVSMVDGQVYVDGSKMLQPYLVHHGESTEDKDSIAPVKVPAGDIFVLGDHRDDSEDSRMFGPVALSEVKGVAFWAYWPFSRFGPL